MGERLIYPAAACYSLEKYGFYNKNVCLFKNDCALRLVSSVFAKLENTDRCTLDGSEEQRVVTCNVCGDTNSTRPKPNWDTTIGVVGRLNWCADWYNLDDSIKARSRTNPPHSVV